MKSASWLKFRPDARPTARFQEQAQAWTGQLEQRVAQRTQELEALYSVSREISSRLGIEDVLCSITQKPRSYWTPMWSSMPVNRFGQTMALHAASGPEAAIVQCTSPFIRPSARCSQ